MPGGDASLDRHLGADQVVPAAGEAEVDQARAVLLQAHVAGDVRAHILDLAAYELGNVLIRALRWDPVSVADQLDDLRTIVGTPLS